MLGTAKLLLDKDMEPKTLIDTVTSAKGTTAEGLRVLEGSPIAEIMLATVSAAAPTQPGTEFRSFAVSRPTMLALGLFAKFPVVVLEVDAHKAEHEVHDLGQVHAGPDRNSRMRNERFADRHFAADVFPCLPAARSSQECLVERPILVHGLLGRVGPGPQ